MTALVTGGAGYIGGHMAWELVDRGEKSGRTHRGDIGDAGALVAVLGRGDTNP